MKIAAQGATETYVLEILGILSFVSMQILRLGPFSILILFFLVIVIMGLRELFVMYNPKKMDKHDVYLSFITNSSN